MTARLITARFQVSGFDSSTIPGITTSEPSEDWVVSALMRKKYVTGLIGESVATFVSSGPHTNGGYLAAERISGWLEDGQGGSVTVHHWGTKFGEDLHTDGIIIAGSGTGGFADWSGAAVIVHDEQGPYFEFRLR